MKTKEEREAEKLQKKRNELAYGGRKLKWWQIWRGIKVFLLHED